MKAQPRKKACLDCSKLCAFAMTNCMEGYGPVPADIMIVGEAPGKDEDEAGRAFVGAAGKYLERQILMAVGLDRDEIRMTNAVRCRPPDNRTPRLPEILKCRHYLVDEIALVKPKVIIAVGNVPLHALIPLHKQRDAEEMAAKKYNSGTVSGITKWRGKLLWSREFNCYVMPTWHPSALRRDINSGVTYRKRQCISDFERAIAVAEKARPKFLPPETVLVNDADYVVRLLQALSKEEQTVAFDWETEDLDPRSKLQGFSLAVCGETGYYIDWAAVENDETRVALQQFLVAPCTKVFHNSAFDVRVCKIHHYEVRYPYHDTMVAAALLDENFPKGLKPLTWRYLMFGGYEVALDDYRREHKLRTFANIPAEVMAPYSACDAIATWRLWEKFVPQLQKQKLWPLYHHIMMPTRDMMTDIEVEGFDVDVPRAKKLDVVLDKAAEKMRQSIYKKAGKEFNLRSTAQLGDTLFEEMGLQPPDRTASGRYKTDKATLKKAATQEGGEVVQQLLDLRYIEKMQKTFVHPIIENAWDDGRIHTQYNSTGTVTGRISCSNPGIHNIPRDGLIRSLFIAGRGSVLVRADIKSAELRILAVYSGEEALIDAFRDGVDVHNRTYNIMYGKSMAYVPTEDERFIAKTINFGLIYGRGARSLAALLDTEVDEAQRLIDQYFEALPKVRAWLLQNIDDTRKNGYAVSLFGRRRRLPEINSDDSELVASAKRQANNSVIQGAAADYTYVGMLRVRDRIRHEELPARIVHTVHDCCIVSTKEKRGEYIAQLMKEEFERPLKVVPIKMEIDITIGSTWGDGHDSYMKELLKTLKAV